VEETTSNKATAPRAGLRFGDVADMKAGERAKIAVYVDGATLFRSAVLGLKFDDKKLAVRSVQFGEVYGQGLANTAATPFLNQNGKLYVTLSTSNNAVEKASGVIAYIEVEALADGRPELSFDKDVLNLLTVDGKNFLVSF
jgi:Cohesin domain